ncbi:hypothetical protein [Enterococcus gilvus]|uniref:hypothetical protein n=1 Tax=Enterococcus gilvus TaxID=160453 RepID=UPI0028D1CD94|nr:hypothetical protein [Enterococcus gilvus]
MIAVGNSHKVNDDNKNAMDQIINQYGKSIYNIDLLSNAISADRSGPTKSLKQDVSKVFDKFKNNKEVEGIYPKMTLSNISISIEGITNDHSIKSTNNEAVNSGLLTGKMLNNNKKEVLVPSSLLKSMGIDKKSIIGKTINLKGTINDKNNQAKAMTIIAKIAGVINSNMDSTEEDGTKVNYSIDDGFIYSKKIVDEVYDNAGKDKSQESIQLRVKNLSSIGTIVDQLEEMGLTPTGTFQLANNLSTLSDNTKEETNMNMDILKIVGFGTVIISILLFSIFQKKEKTIMRYLGYEKRDMRKFFRSLVFIWLVVTLGFYFLISPLVPTLAEMITGNDFEISMSFCLIQLLVISLAIFCVTGLSWNRTSKKELVNGDD